MILPDFPLLEVILGIAAAFIAYTLRKTDAKIDGTAYALASHKLEVAAMHFTAQQAAYRDFATKLELRDVEQRATTSNREVLAKLDRLIDRLIDNT